MLINNVSGLKRVPRGKSTKTLVLHIVKKGFVLCAYRSPIKNSCMWSNYYNITVLIRRGA